MNSDYRSLPKKTPVTRRARGPARVVTPQRDLLDIDWKALRLFMNVARSDSLRSAAGKTGQAHNTISRKIAILERNLGRVLMTRTHDGIRLTPEGQKLLTEVERMDLVLTEFAHALGNEDSGLSGSVNLGAVQLLGSFWLPSGLYDFQSSFPDIAINLHMTPHSFDVLRMEVDLCLQCQKPTALGAIMRRLGKIHFMPFASKAYLSRHNPMNFHADPSGHRFVLCDQAPVGNEQISALVAAAADSGGSIVRTPCAATQVQAVACGAGIGWLPTFVAHSGSSELVPLSSSLCFSSDVWLTYHPDAGRVGRNRRVIDWLAAQFDPGRFPCFRDQFIDPREWRGTCQEAPAATDHAINTESSVEEEV